jgi:hypothetical protein
MEHLLMNVASDDTYAGGSDASDQPSWVATNNFTFDANLGPHSGFWKRPTEEFLEPIITFN